jgi:hypothetical protein
VLNEKIQHSSQGKKNSLIRTSRSKLEKKQYIQLNILVRENKLIKPNIEQLTRKAKQYIQLRDISLKH